MSALSNWSWDYDGWIVLAGILAVSATTNAQDIPFEPYKYDLGAAPTGKVVELDGWACGNIVVEDFSSAYLTLTLKVNLPAELYINDAEALDHLNYSWPLKQGAIHTVQLRNDARFSMYWLLEPVDWNPASRVTRTVKLVIRRHCPASKCANLCDCQ